MRRWVPKPWWTPRYVLDRSRLINDVTWYLPAPPGSTSPASLSQPSDLWEQLARTTELWRHDLDEQRRLRYHPLLQAGMTGGRRCRGRAGAW